MAGVKETPRQKMIGMMYLVLTALLALNVSKSILESFVRVNESLETTNENFNRKNANLYGELSATAAQNKKRQKVQEAWALAQEVRDSANGVYNHIDSMKAFLLKEVEGLPSMDSASNFTLAQANGLANYDVPTNRLGVSTPKDPKGGRYSARRLHQMIERYRDYLFRVYADNQLLKEEGKDTSSLKLNLETDGNPNLDAPSAKTWEGLHFYHAPLAATFTALSKMQNDIQNAESETVTELLEKVGKKKFNIDTTATKVVPLNGSYIAVGDTYRAEVVVAAWSKANQPDVKVGQNIDTAGNLTGPPDTGNISVKHGMGIYEFVPTEPGQVKWGGKIGIKKPDGTFQYNQVPVQTVRAAEQNVVVSPTKMNVLYRGLPNPLSISVPGMAAEDLEASMSNGSLRQEKAGSYIASPGNASDESVVTVRDQAGKRLGDMRFRVKDVPRPQPFFAGNTTTDNYVSANRLQVANKVEARLEDFLFEGVSFDVVEFEIGATVGGQFPTETQQGGSSLSSRQQELLKNVQPGGRVVVRNIVAIDPGGKRRNLSSLSFQIQ